MNQVLSRDPRFTLNQFVFEFKNYANNHRKAPHGKDCMNPALQNSIKTPLTFLT